MHFAIDEPVGPFITRRLLTLRQRLLATKAYLSEYGEPRSLDDLGKGHALLFWIAPGEPAPVVHHRGRAQPITPLIRSTDVHMLRTCAAAGQGIAYIPDAEGAAPAADTLVPVLEDQVFRELGLYLTVPSALAEIPKVKTVLRQFFGFIDGIRV